VPLATPFVVTIAVNKPVAFGRVEKVIVSVVAVAAVTVPIAPLLNTMVFPDGVVLKPKPEMVMVFELIARFAVLSVTTGLTLATCTAVPLETPLVVTTAVKGPADVGFVENVTVRDVAVAAVTVPTAPLLNTTVLFPAVVLNPAPLMMTVSAFAASEVVATVTAGLTVAICFAAPLFSEFVVTIAVRLPSAAGFVENVTVNFVAVAVVTVPTAPLLKTTVFFEATGSKPKPSIITVAELMPSAAVLAVTNGVTSAT